MNQERLVYLAIKDEIDQMPQQVRDHVYAAANDLKATIARHGEYGTPAVALVGAEIAAQE